MNNAMFINSDDNDFLDKMIDIFKQIQEPIQNPIENADILRLMKHLNMNVPDCQEVFRTRLK